MKEENRRYAEEAFEIVEHAAKKIGSRLPGSDGEKSTRLIWEISSEVSVLSLYVRNLPYLRERR